MRQKEGEAGGRRVGREGRWRGQERRHRGKGKGLIGERIEDVVGTMRGGINAHARFFCVPPPLHTSHTHMHTHTHTHTHPHPHTCTPCTVSHPRWRYGSKCSSEEEISSAAQLHVCQRSDRRRGEKLASYSVNDFLNICMGVPPESHSQIHH